MRRPPKTSLENRILHRLWIFVPLALVAVVLATLGFVWTVASVAAVIVTAVFWFLFRGDGTSRLGRLVASFRGERTVIQLLASLERQGFVVRHRVDSLQGDVDHVVVGPTGVFAIESRNRRTDQASWQARRGEMFVKDALRVSGVLTWVDAIVVSTRARVQGDELRDRNVSILSASMLPRFIMSCRVRLTEQQVARAAAALGAVPRQARRLRLVTAD